MYFSKLGLLRVDWGGTITLAALKRHFELLKANTRYARSLLAITSFDGTEIAFELSEQNMALVSVWRLEALSRYDSIRTAFVGLNPVPAAYVNYFSSFFDAPNSTLRQFATEEEARAWLLSPCARPPRG